MIMTIIKRRLKGLKCPGECSNAPCNVPRQNYNNFLLKYLKNSCNICNKIDAVSCPSLR